MLDRYDHDLLLDYLEGELDADQRAQLDAALKDDPQLAALLRAMSDDRELLRSLPREQVPGEISQDLTQALERKMLLDDSADEIGPIPIARGRGLPTQPPRQRGWGRVVGLTGLAAAVAIAAGVVVFQLPDPLVQTANQLADRLENGQADESDRAATAPENDDTTPAPAATENNTADRNDRLGPLARALITPPDNPAADRAPAADEPGVALGEALSNTNGLARNTPERRSAPADGAARGNDPAWLAAEPQTVAISTMQPRQQLVLYAEEPDRVREQLVNFCIANGIPIVEAEDPTAAQTKEDEASAAPENEARERAEQTPPADPQADPEADPRRGNESRPRRNVALLINRQQLSELVYGFNNDLAITPDKTGRAVLDTQAAVVQPLGKAGATDRLADHNPDEDADPKPGFDLNKALSNTVAYEAPAAGEAQAIQLYLPRDLGSDYANRVNGDNFIQEQRRNTFYDSARLARAEAPTPARPGEAASNDAAEAADGATLGIRPEREVADPAADPAEKAQAPPVAEPAEKASDAGGHTAARAESETDAKDTAPAEQAEAEPDAEAEAEAGSAATDVAAADAARPGGERLRYAEPAPPLDRSRNNWLAPHLPLTDTTLILNWRLDTEADPAELVPIQIKQAPADQVRSLRRQQQARPAEAEAEPEAETKPAAENVDTTDDASDDAAE